MAAFIELVQTSNGTTHRGKDPVGGQSKQKRIRSSAKEEKKNMSVVPSHMVRTDISGVKGDTLIFSGIMFYFVNVPPTHSLDSLHKIVAENGGTFSMNLNNSVTHCVAAESRGIKYKAAIRKGDVIHYSWVLDCCSQKKLLPLQPKYFLFLSDSSKKKLQEDIDEFSDSYYWDLDLADIKQLLSNIDKVEDAKVIDHYKEKYGPLKWSHFHGCSIYLHASLQSLKPDLETLFGLSLRRLKVEVKMNGGKVTESLSEATHLVVLWIPGFTMDLENVLKSFTVREKRFLLKGMLNIVQSQWLEDSLERNLRLPEETYSLKPMLEKLNIVEDGEDDSDVKASSPLDYRENQELPISISPNKERNEALEESSSRSLAAPKARKRGRPKSTKGKALANQTRRTRARIGRKPAKISGNESNESVSEGEQEKKCAEEIRLVKREKTRGRTGEKKAVELSSDDDSNIGTDRTDLEADEASKAIETEGADDFGSPKRDVKDVRQWFRKSPEAKMVVNHVDEDDSKKALTHEKIEVMTDPDPVHAMLLDMIPSLKKDKTEPPTSTSSTSTSVVVKDTTEADPSKKKKVSYKDLANQLLNDF